MSDIEFSPEGVYPEYIEEEKFPRHFKSLYYPGAGEDYTSAIEFYDADEYHLVDRNEYINLPERAVEKLKKIGCDEIEIAEHPDQKMFDIKFLYHRSRRPEDPPEKHTLTYQYGIDATVAVPDDMDMLYCHGYFPISGSKKPKETAEFIGKIKTGTHIYNELPFHSEMLGFEQVGNDREHLKKSVDLPEEQIAKYFNLGTIFNSIRSLYVSLYESEQQFSDTKKEELKNSLRDYLIDFKAEYSKLSEEEHNHVLESFSKNPKILEYIGVEPTK